MTTRERDRTVLLAGAAMTAGVVLGVVGGLAHPHRELPNSHREVFAEYAGSTAWTWVHLVQFTAAALVVVGLALLHVAMAARGQRTLLGRVAVGAGTATVAVFAVNMAVDGVALKRAVDAWVAAPPDERPARFAAAEVVRWLEWGSNAFFQLLLGTTLVLVGLAVARTAVVAPALGWAAAAGGACLVGNSVLTAYEGFEGSPLATASSVLVLVVGVGVLVSGIRGRVGAGMQPAAAGA